MPWVRAIDLTPPEGERVLIHDGGSNAMRTGLYVGGRWLVEDPRDGRLAEAEGVTHWAPLLDSEDYDPADD